jgi:hypothetical protein
MTYIEREALIKEFDKISDHDVDVDEAIELIADFPAADVVKVVRCKDCKHIYGPYDNGPDGQVFFCGYWTDQWDMETELEGFCHSGEKRED